MNARVRRRWQPGQGRAERRRRGGSFRRALRAEALRRAELPRPVAPVTGRMRRSPYQPAAAPVHEDLAVRHAKVARRRGRKSQKRGRNAAHCLGRPSTRKGTRRSFLTTPQKGSSGPTLARGASSPKLRPVRRAILGLTWDFTEFAGWRSGYFKVSGIAAPRRLKACLWVLVGSVSIGTVTWVPVYRTWLRVRVARCSSRPRKLR